MKHYYYYYYCYYYKTLRIRFNTVLIDSLSHGEHLLRVGT